MKFESVRIIRYWMTFIYLDLRELTLHYGPFRNRPPGRRLSDDCVTDIGAFYALQKLESLKYLAIRGHNVCKYLQNWNRVISLQINCTLNSYKVNYTYNAHVRHVLSRISLKPALMSSNLNASSCENVHFHPGKA